MTESARAPTTQWRPRVRAALDLARSYEARNRAGLTVGEAGSALNLDAAGRASVGPPEGAGSVDLTPPELTGADQRHGFEPNHDAYGLALAVFSLLLPGSHPYAGARRDGKVPPRSEATQQRLYAYGRGGELLPMPGSPRPAIAGPEVEALFERAFTADPAIAARPAPGQWVAALATLEASLETCREDPRHAYRHDSGPCPWCAAAKRSPPPVPQAGDGGPKDAIEAALAACDQIARRRPHRPPMPSAEVPKADERPFPPQKEGAEADPALIARAEAALRSDRLTGLAAGAMLAAAGLTLALLAEGWARMAGIGLIGLSPATYLAIANLGPGSALADEVESFKTPEAATGDRPEPSNAAIDAVVTARAAAARRQQKCRADWSRIDAEAEAAETALKADAQAVRESCQALQEQARAATAKARETMKARSKARHLHAKLIADAKIPGIDEGAKRSLATYGIRSAQDVLTQRIESVPLIGDTRAGSLRHWAEACRKSAPYRDDGWEVEAKRIQDQVLATAETLLQQAERLLADAGDRDRRAEARRVAVREEIASAAQAMAVAERRAEAIGYEFEDLARTPFPRVRADGPAMVMAYAGWRNPRKPRRSRRRRWRF